VPLEFCRFHSALQSVFPSRTPILLLPSRLKPTSFLTLHAAGLCGRSQTGVFSSRGISIADRVRREPGEQAEKGADRPQLPDPPQPKGRYQGTPPRREQHTTTRMEDSLLGCGEEGSYRGYGRSRDDRYVATRMRHAFRKRSRSGSAVLFKRNTPAAVRVEEGGSSRFSVSAREAKPTVHEVCGSRGKAYTPVRSRNVTTGPSPGTINRHQCGQRPNARFGGGLLSEGVDEGFL